VLPALVLAQEPLAPVTIVRARAVGGPTVRGEDTILAVCVDDPAFARIQRHDERPPHVSKELLRFFADRAAREGGASDVGAMYDRDRALAVIEQAVSAYVRLATRS
jgi:inorganic pyrophosphatase